MTLNKSITYDQTLFVFVCLSFRDHLTSWLQKRAVAQQQAEKDRGPDSETNSPLQQTKASH